jgi:hypothetical protein
VLKALASFSLTNNTRVRQTNQNGGPGTVLGAPVRGTQTQDIYHLMNGLFVAAAIAVAILPSPVSAVEVFNYGASADFGRKIGRYYESAPEWLKDNIGSARVTVVGDMASLEEVFREYGVQANAILSFKSKGTAAMALPGWPPYSRTRAIVIFQPATAGPPEQWQRRVVYHEMMHLFDLRPTFNKAITNTPSFNNAYLANRQRYDSAFEKATPERKAFLKEYIGYFANDPKEAFAEAGARIILPVGKESYFDTIFQEVNAYVRKIMVAFGDTVAKK